MVIRPDGYILTNFHVIQAAEAIKVNLPNGKTYDARVVGHDQITDLAILKIDPDEDLPTITFGDSDDLHVGDWVVAMGNALALKGGPTVTLGIVSARGRTINTERGALYDLIQTDAAINEGNSGGPLVNLNGEVIGINTAILRQAQGIGFAVSSSVGEPIINSLIEHGRVVRPLIGLTGTDVTPARANQLNLSLTEGIIVTRMTTEGPAYQAGIRQGDVITRINDIPTPDMAAFLTLLWTYDVGDAIAVEYVSNGKVNVAQIELVERTDGI
jgi:serine protease Do